MEKLHIQGLSKSYGTIKAVDSLTLELHTGELLAILGPSGCGKSTLLSCIAGIERPEGGEISLDGRLLFSSAVGIEIPPEKR